jgi:hypothetical protein
MNRDIANLNLDYKDYELDYSNIIAIFGNNSIVNRQSLNRSANIALNDSQYITNALPGVRISNTPYVPNSINKSNLNQSIN